MTVYIDGSWVHPVTGEIHELDDTPHDELISLAHEMVQRAALIVQARRELDSEIERRRREVSPSAKGLEGGRWIAQRSVSRSWDARMTVAALQALAENGSIAPGEAVSYVREVPALKPDGRALNALLTRLTDAGDLNGAQALLNARQEKVRYTYEEVIG